MIKLIIDNKNVDLKWTEFSDGAINVQLIDFPTEVKSFISIAVDPKTPVRNVREEVDLVLSALHNTQFHGYIHVYLHMAYLPYARADRVFEDGNALPLEMFMDWLGNCRFDKIFIEDIHNPTFIEMYYPDLPIEINDQFRLAIQFIEKENPDYILAPDKGALDKATMLSIISGVHLITADKVRYVSTGKILSINLNEKPKPNSTVFIVDDILDGGGTFIPLAKELKSLGCTVILYVTHLIGAKGLDVLEGIDRIHCINLVGNYVSREDLIDFNNKVK